MFDRVHAAVTTALLVLAATAPSASAVDVGPPQHIARQALAGKGHVQRGATLTSSAKQVEEGDRLSLTATIRSPKQASRVTLQRWNVPQYYGTPAWEPVTTRAVRDNKRVKFRAVATDLNSEKFRVTVTYKGSKPSSSKPIRVKIWRWIPLSEYAPYYQTSGVTFGETTLNGQRYVGWGAATWSHAGAWEARFTPGRHCKAFRGVIGVADISGDGSSGTIDFTADDESAYQSPSLTPGMDVGVEVPLAKPYRFGIQLADTSPEGVDSWPVIGEPALLCTGV